MTEQLVRPTHEDIKNAYNRLFNSSLSLSRLQDASLGGRLLTSSSDAFAVVGRGMAWRLFLCRSEPLHSPSDEPPEPCIEAWRTSRKTYVDLLLQTMRAPDGSYEEGLVIPGISSLPKRRQSSAVNLEKNNPLSLHDENPWNSWFASVELRKTILQDVERTFPDLGYFRDPEVQSHLTNILFVYSVENLALGYRQGMHELLAPILFAVDFDSISDTQAPALGDPAISEFCSRTWVAADAYALFVAMMRGVGKWYEWQESAVPSGSRSPLSTQAKFNIPNGQVDLKPYMAPIVETCNRLQSTYLKSVDPDLWGRLQAVGIEPQIYGIRWLRLLFTREFSMPDAMILWDGLFACDPTFDLAQWICVAMLIRIRNQLLPADYSGQLTYLLRYPAPSTLITSTSDSETPLPFHHVSLLLRQALTMQMAPSLATGAAIVYENRNFLNIPVEVPDFGPPRPRRRSQIGERVRSSPAVDSAFRKADHSRQYSSSSMGLPEMIARGLLDRSESLGINKTVMNAVTELKRNLPDLASSFIIPPSQPPSFQLVNERVPEERPLWEPKSRFQVEREVAEDKLLRKKLGDAVEWILDALLENEDTADQDKVKSVGKKREALESLAYVRDILKGRAAVVDDERLFNADELLKRKGKAKLEAADESSQASRIKPITATAHSPSASSQWGSTTTGARSSRESYSSTKTSFMPSLSSSRHSSQSTTPLNPSSKAPGNYTESNIKSTLPRSPSPTSTVLRPSTYLPTPPPINSPPTIQGQNTQRKAQQDPLGVGALL